MIVALAFHAGDVRSALDLLKWIGQMGGSKRHCLVLVVDNGVSWTDGIKALRLGREAFATAQMFATGRNVSGWIEGSNSLWVKAAEVGAGLGQPWLFLEPDAVPLKADWLDRIEAEYSRCDKSYLGAIVTHQTPGIPSPYMEGVAVYPATAHQELAGAVGSEKSWTQTTAALVIPKAAHTPLIQHLWGEKGNPPTFAEKNVPGTNVFCRQQIRSDAVIFHRNKDGTLINLLRHAAGLKKSNVVSSAKLDLKRVTLWSCVWNHNPSLLARTIQVLQHCMNSCDFGEVILFTSHAPTCAAPFTVIPISTLDMAGWNKFINFDLPQHIRTDFALSVHEDGFILDPSLWTSDFLNYDYIGAPWADHVVGNGGFFMASRKMLNAQVKLPPNVQNQNADMYVCRTHRAALEQQGVRFAPEGLALRFSTETTFNQQPSFGFHGRKDSPAKYRAGWEQIEKRSPITMVYICVAGNQKYQQYADRFLRSYQEKPPGIAHDTVVVLNGGQVTDEIVQKFSALPECTFLEHDNSGYDLGGYQQAARLFPSNLMLFLSASTFFTRAGWLSRMAAATQKHGEAIYGAMGNRGQINIGVYPHLRTTAFWLSTDLFTRYPTKVVRNDQRHPFEHGPDNLTLWVKKQGLKALVVTWSGEYEWAHWDDDPNGYSRGNQSSLLAGDHLCEPPYFPRR